MHTTTPTAVSPLQAAIDRSAMTPIQISVVVLCALIAFVEGADIGLVPLLAPQIIKEWGLPPAAITSILAAGPVGLAVGGIAMGYLGDLVGRRPALIGTMVLMTLGTLATAWAGSTIEMILCRLVTGIGFGGVVPAATALVSEFTPLRRRTQLISLVILMQAVGGLAFIFTLSQIGQAYHWQTLILTVGAICLAVTVLTILFLPESARYLLVTDPHGRRTDRMLHRLRLTGEDEIRRMVDVPARKGARISQLFEQGRAQGTLLLWVAFFGLSMLIGFATQWLALIYTYAGKSSAVAVNALLAFQIGGIFSGLVLPLISRRVGVTLVLAATMLLGSAAVLVLGLAVTGSNVIIYVMTGLAGVFISGSLFIIYSPTVTFYPTEIRSTGSGTATSVGRIGNILAPIIAGSLLAGGFSPTNILMVFAVPLLLSSLAIFLFRVRCENLATE